MKFKVVARTGTDTSFVPPVLTTPPFLGPSNRVRQVSVNELDSASQLACFDANGVLVAVPPSQCLLQDPTNSVGPYGPTKSLLGTVNADGTGNPLHWADDITENPALNSTETWEILDTTADAHPIHVHLVHFRVLSRQIATADSPNFNGHNIGARRGPEPWETGFKDTVIVYPGEITRIQATFDIAGLYVWHCHILEHEDNEMMRPYCVGSQKTCPVQIAPGA
jgi:FtsP/CotA-like multicopper oxidase with cupredoxin domain